MIRSLSSITNKRGAFRAAFSSTFVMRSPSASYHRTNIFTFSIQPTAQHPALYPFSSVSSKVESKDEVQVTADNEEEDEEQRSAFLALRQKWRGAE